MRDAGRRRYLNLEVPAGVTAILQRSSVRYEAGSGLRSEVDSQWQYWTRRGKVTGTHQKWYGCGEGHHQGGGRSRENGEYRPKMVVSIRTRENDRRVVPHYHWLPRLDRNLPNRSRGAEGGIRNVATAREDKLAHRGGAIDGMAAVSSDCDVDARIRARELVGGRKTGVRIPSLQMGERMGGESGKGV